ncbi:hypothetical protein ABK040_002738 [Willaertia magna]
MHLKEPFSLSDTDETLVLKINWIKLPLEDENKDIFYCKFQNDKENVIIYLSNLKSVWKKKYNKEEMLKDSSTYCKGLTMTVDALIEQIKLFLLHSNDPTIKQKNKPTLELLKKTKLQKEEQQGLIPESVQSVHLEELKELERTLIIRIKALLPTAAKINLPFYWEIHFERLVDEQLLQPVGSSSSSLPHSFYIIHDSNSLNNNINNNNSSQQQENDFLEPNVKKRKTSDDNETSLGIQYPKENLFLFRHVIQPLLGIVNTQKKQMEQLKSLCLKQEQELVNFRQMYSGSTGNNNTNNTMEALEKILSSEHFEKLDMSFEENGVMPSLDSTSLDSVPQTILQKLYCKFMKQKFEPSSNKEKTSSSTNGSSSNQSLESNSQKETTTNNGVIINNTNNITIRNYSQTQAVSKEKEIVKEGNNNKEATQESVLIIASQKSGDANTSQLSDTTNEEEQQRRLELEQKLEEKRKKKMLNESKAKIRKAFM